MAPVPAERFAPVSAPLLAAALLLAPPAEPLPTAAELAAGLARVRAAAVAATRDVHVVFGTRSLNRYGGPNAPATTSSLWCEAFLKGDAAQMRKDWSAPPAGGWFPGTPSGAPLTGESAAGLSGRVTCLRPPGGGAGRSEFLPRVAVLRGRGATLWDGLFSLHAGVERFDAAIPHVFAGRSWSDAAASAGPLSRFARTDPAAWVVEAREVKDGRPAIRVLAVANGPHRFPSEAHGGTLEITSGLRAWFTDDAHRDLVRVEDAHVLRYDGAEIPQPYAGGAAPVTVSTVRDFRPLPGGARAPFAGSLTIRSTVPPAAGEEPSTWAGPDPLIEEFLRTGAVADASEVYVHTETEWRIETLEPLPPSVTAADLWLVPPDGTQVTDLVTDTERIAGMNWVTSWLVLTFRSRNAPAWAFGPPAALFAAAGVGWWWRRRRRRWLAA